VVRQTLLELERRGLIYRVKGRGSYVAQPKLSQVFTELTSFTEATRARGERPSSRVLIQDMCPASETIAQFFGIPPGTPVFRLRRVRLADETPLAVETAHLHFEACEALLNEDLSNASLYQLLGRRYGIVPSYVEETYEATIVEVKDVPHLGIPPGSPAMLTTRLTYDQEMRPFEFYSGVFRGDRVRFQGVLRRTQKGDKTAR
jgi:GntR family transcriptional regulator